MRHTLSLLLASVVYGATISPQLASLVSRQSPPDIGGVVGEALQGAGGIVDGVAQGLRGAGSPVTDLPAGILDGVAAGLNGAGAAAKGPKYRRQAVGDVGGIVGGALTSVGDGLVATGKGLEGSLVTAIPGNIVESVGQGLQSAGKSTVGSTGNPRLIALRRRRAQVPNPADVVGQVGQGLTQGAAAAGGPGSGIVGQVGEGLQQGAKGAKESPAPKMMARQLFAPPPPPSPPSPADAAGVLGAVGDALKGNPLTALPGSIVEGVGSAIGKGPKRS